METAAHLATKSVLPTWLQSHDSHGIWWYYVGAAGGITAHLTLALPRYVWYQRLLACVPLIVLLILLRQCFRQTSKNVPVLVIVALQIYIFYSVPQFTQEGITLLGGNYYEPSQAAVTESMLLVVAGELVFLVSYSTATRISSRLTPLFYSFNPTPRLHWMPVVFLYAGLGFVIYAWTALRPEFIPVAVKYTAGTLLNVYLALTILLYLGYTSNKKGALIFGHLLALAMSAVGFVQGLLGAMLGPLFVVFLGRWIWGRGLSVRALVLIALAAILLNPVKDEFRVLAWGEKDVSSLDRVEERLEDWAVAFQSVWIEGSSDRTPVTSTASRANDLLPFAQAIDYVPDVVPYNKGDGLTDALLFWIPRVVWPSKKSSSDLVYNQYAVDFGFSDLEGTKTTTVGASVFTEGYWNFDKYGVLGFLLIYGFILGFLFGNNGRAESVSVIICVVYVGPSIFILQALTVVVASLFSFLVGITISLWSIGLLSQFLKQRIAPAAR